MSSLYSRQIISYKYMLASKIFIMIFYPSEHHTLNERSLVNISSNDVISAIPCTECCTTSKQWTFEAPENLRVRLTFENFSFPDPHGYLEIGDGIIIGENTRLAHFTGTSLPSNVTSVTNAAWITVHVRCGNINETFNIKITAVNYSGELYIYFEGKVKKHMTDTENFHRLG